MGNYQWPIVGRPSTQMWATWRTALHLCLTSRKLKVLDCYLGGWLEIPSQWRWFLDKNYTLYEKLSNNMVAQYDIMYQTRHYIRHNKTSTNYVQIDALDLIPTTVQILDDSIVSKGMTKVNKIPPVTSMTRPQYHRWLQYSLEEHRSRQDVATKLQHGDITAVTDGSFMRHLGLGTAAWTIADEKYTPVVTGTSFVPGDRSCQSAFRSEAVGVLAILDYIDSICQEFHIQHGSMLLYCDNNRILQIAEEWISSKMTPKHKNADILSAIIKTRDRLPIRIEYVHVKAHQDDETPINLLPPEVQLNIQMDAKAKETLHMFHTCPSLIPATSPHPNSFPSCKWKQTQITQELASSLYYHITHEKMTKYWLEKKRLTSAALSTVDFEAISLSSKSMPLYLKRFTTKWASECIATGKNMKRWSLRYEGYCPYCAHPNETTKHIMTCKDVQSVNNWDETIEKFYNKLTKMGTCGMVKTAFQQEIFAWRHGIEPPSTTQYSWSIQHAIEEQRQIGWNLFFEGLISKRWAEHMDTYFAAKGNFHTSTKWKQSLIRSTWEVTYAIWEFRNAQLHETQRIKDMEGIPSLKSAITAEWKQGLGCLPASEFSHFFTRPVEDILSQSDDYLKNWFLTVRQGRIMLDERHLVQDEFKTSRALQDWIGISQNITDREVKPLLIDACQQELDIGLGQLPHKHYNNFFNNSKSQLITETIDYLKTWLQRIRQGRLLMDPTNLINDAFMIPGLLQHWLQKE